VSYTCGPRRHATLLLRNGSASWELSRLMVARMLHASEMLEGLAFQPVAGALAHLLVELPHDEKSGADLPQPDSG